jgi:hypothetical protein
MTITGFRRITILGITAAFLGCGGGGGDAPDPPASGPPPPPPPPPPLFSGANPLPDLPGTSFVYVLEAIDLNFDGMIDIVLSGPKWRSGVGFVDEEVSLHVYMNNSTQNTPSFSYTTLPGSLVHPRAAAQADLNGDGVIDLAIGDHGHDVHPRPGHEDLLFLSDISGMLIETESPLFQNTGFSHDIAGGDIDNDGDIDLVVADLTSNPIDTRLRVLTNNGSGQFSLSFLSLGIETGSYPANVLTDVNIDGNLDLVLGAQDSSLVSAVMVGVGNGGFAGPLPLPDAPSFAIVPEILAADINADGYVDLVLSRTGDTPFYEGRYIQFLINDGSGIFVDTPLMPDQDIGDKWATEIYFVDIDGDGLKDIVLRTDSGTNLQSVFLQQLDGTFSPIELPNRGGTFPFDFDNDGDIDLLLHNHVDEGSTVSVLINNLDAM